MNEARTVAGRGGNLIVLFVLFCAVFAERAVIGVSTGGAGILGLVNLLAPLAAAIVVLRYGASQTLGFMASGRFVFAVLPYLLLDATLPVMGIIYNHYTERTLWSITDATTAFSFLVLGACLASRLGDAAESRNTAESGDVAGTAWQNDAGFWRWLFVAMVLQLVYALGQTAYVDGLPGGQIFAPFHDWDLSLQSLYGALVQARGSGLYFNPNELGLWAGMVAILAWTVFPPKMRTAGVIVAIFTLFLSQSRGASVALVSAALVATLLAIVTGRVAVGGTIRSVLTFGLAIALAVGVALVIEPTGAVFGRFAALINVATQGPQADANLAGRIDYWSAVVALNAVYPFGTWGSPEVILGTAIDSSWFRAFAQGSVPYLATLGLVMVAGLTIGEFRYSQPLRLVTVMIAVAGLTQTSMSYPAIALFWMLLGYGLKVSVAERPVTEASPEVAHSTGPSIGAAERAGPPSSAPGERRSRSPYGVEAAARTSPATATIPSPGALSANSSHSGSPTR